MPVFVNEIVPQFNETYRKNRNLSDEQYFVGDIKKLNEKIDEYLPRFKDTDLVCGGPPCQGFSMANRQRIIDDPRNQLYKEYLKLLSVVRPKFFIMENVRGMSNKWEEIRENFETYLNSDDNKKYQFSLIFFMRKILEFRSIEKGLLSLEIDLEFLQRKFSMKFLKIRKSLLF